MCVHTTITCHFLPIKHSSLACLHLAIFPQPPMQTVEVIWDMGQEAASFRLLIPSRRTANWVLFFQALQYYSFPWGLAFVFRFPKFSFSLFLTFSRHVHARHLKNGRSLYLKVSVCCISWSCSRKEKTASITEYLNKLCELSFNYAKCCL